jgi:hypothetical protein
MTGTKSPKDFNMDNPLQAEGAARGIEAAAVWCIHSRTTTTTTPPINHKNHSSDNSVTSFPILNFHLDKKD